MSGVSDVLGVSLIAVLLWLFLYWIGLYYICLGGWEAAALATTLWLGEALVILVGILLVLTIGK